jgi:cytoskeletal protein RodZ
MALVSCKECGREVSHTAKACPNCGASPPISKSKLRLVLISLVVLATIAGGTFYYWWHFVELPRFRRLNTTSSDDLEPSSAQVRAQVSMCKHLVAVAVRDFHIEPDFEGCDKIESAFEDKYGHKPR